MAVAPPPPTTLHTLVPARSNFVAAVAPFHMGADVVQAWIRAARPVFNLGHIQAGNAVALVETAAGEPQALSYQIDANHTLWLRAQPAPAPASSGTA
ncbi:MAG: hypothetical protein ACRD1L_07340, partial [Terriglobales bacterium]